MISANRCGKRAAVNSSDLERIILNFKDQILKNGQISSRGDKVWEDISKQLEGKVKPTTLHSYVVGTRYNFRQKFLGDEERPKGRLTDNSRDSTHSDTSINLDGVNHSFIISLTKTEYQKLLTERLYKRSDRGKAGQRMHTILDPTRWTEIISKKIFDDTRLRHAFNFKTHHLYRDGSEGKIKGKITLYRLLYLSLINSVIYLGINQIYSLDAMYSIDKMYSFLII